MTTITIGRRLVPVEHIALVEHFDTAANPRLRGRRHHHRPDGLNARAFAAKGRPSGAAYGR
jgi:hypothetical protein